MNEEKIIPTAIGVIMDGNRRWAKKNNLPTLEGHRAGYDMLRDVATWCKESGIRNLTVYAFSTENWSRSVEEVGYLMNLFRIMINKFVDEAKTNDTKIIFLGERTRFAPDILEAILRAEDVTKDGISFTLGIALSYGGRAEILDAIHRIPESKRANITETEFSELLWTKHIPDPDLIIRTSGEERLSNFLPWQSVYSELFFIETLWPDFTREEFDRILDEYGKRQRRFGS